MKQRNKNILQQRASLETKRIAYLLLLMKIAKTLKPMPPAGSITANFPDADGFVTITSTQGSVEPSCVVLIINDNSGEVVTAIAHPNGSFTGRIRAMLGDEIKIMILDASGNQTLSRTSRSRATTASIS